MIKLIATDMDGTFLNDHHEMPENFESIFERMEEKGIIFCAASGRQYYNLLELFHGMKERMLFIAENGTYVVHKGKELFSKTIERKTAYRLVEKAREIEGTNIVLCGKKSAYIESSDADFLREVDKYYTKCKLVEDLTEVEDDILKVSILDFKGAERNTYPHFESYLSSLQVTVGGFLWLDIMNKEANKGIAIRKVQEYFDVDPQQTMVFGDYLNDLEMMRHAYFSYAMANAHEKLKAAARYEMVSNNELGVTAVIEEHLESVV